MEKSLVRMTRQGRVILEELEKVKTHPTAEAVYLRVRRKLHRISLGTVYRNLETMSAAGLIQRLDLGGTQRRYDGDRSPHLHIRCTECGKIADVDRMPKPELELDSGPVPEQVEGFTITDVKILYEGLCPVCWPKLDKTRKGRAIG